MPLHRQVRAIAGSCCPVPTGDTQPNAQLQGKTDMFDADQFGLTLQIGDCAGNASDAVIAASREHIAFEFGSQHVSGLYGKGRLLVDMRSG